MAKSVLKCHAIYGCQDAVPDRGSPRTILESTMVNRFLKSILVGFAVAFAAGVLALLAPFVSGAVKLWWATRGDSAGIGAFGATIPGLRTVIAVPLGFVIGFYWSFKRGA